MMERGELWHIMHMLIMLMLIFDSLLRGSLLLRRHIVIQDSWLVTERTYKQWLRYKEMVHQANSSAPVRHFHMLLHIFIQILGLGSFCLMLAKLLQMSFGTDCA